MNDTDTERNDAQSALRDASSVDHNHGTEEIPTSQRWRR